MNENNRLQYEKLTRDALEERLLRMMTYAPEGIGGKRRIPMKIKENWLFPCGKRI